MKFHRLSLSRLRYTNKILLNAGLQPDLPRRINFINASRMSSGGLTFDEIRRDGVAAEAIRGRSTVSAARLRPNLV